MVLVQLLPGQMMLDILVWLFSPRHRIYFVVRCLLQQAMLKMQCAAWSACSSEWILPVFSFNWSWRRRCSALFAGMLWWEVRCWVNTRLQNSENLNARNVRYLHNCNWYNSNEYIPQVQLHRSSCLRTPIPACEESCTQTWTQVYLELKRCKVHFADYFSGAKLARRRRTCLQSAPSAVSILFI